MYSVAIFAPSRPSLRVRALRSMQLNVDWYTTCPTRIWQALPMFRVPANSTSIFAPLLLHPVAVLHFGARAPYGVLRTGISRESYDERSKEFRFRLYQQCHVSFLSHSSRAGFAFAANTELCVSQLACLECCIDSQNKEMNHKFTVRAPVNTTYALAPANYLIASM